MKIRFFNVVLCSLVLSVANCSVGPDYHHQNGWAPATWPKTDQQSEYALHHVVAGRLDPQWWRCFNDPLLTQLEERAVSANLDVQMATQRLVAGRAQLLIAGAARFPTLGASAAFQKTQYSQKFFQRGLEEIKNREPILGNVVNPSDIDIPSFNEWDAALDTSWELDLWGRVRRQYESAHALLQASEEDRRGILIAQLAEIARNYITLRGLQAQLSIVKQNETVALQILQLAKERFHGGLVTELDVHDAESQLEQTKAEAPRLEQQIVEYINALGLLLGEPPRALNSELAIETPIPPTPPVVPIGFPSELAQRRPDIREAEAKLHSATADIGIAMADFYPRVMVDARFGFQTLSFRDLGFWSANAWNIGPSISLPIFEGGRLKGQLMLKKAQQKEAALFFRKVVLGAWQEVDNSLEAYQKEQVRQQRFRDTVQLDQESLALAQEQYKEGLQNFINVLDSERRLLAAQRSLLQSQTQVFLNLVYLYKALGGGWERVYPETSIISTR